MSWPIWGTASPSAGDTTITVAAALTYNPVVMPNWPTRVSVSAKTATSFTVEFEVPAPSGALITWFGNGTETGSGLSHDTYADILADVLDRAGEDALDTGTDTFYQTAERQINRTYHDICNTHPFLFLRADPPAVIRTLAPVTGTVAVTEGSANITFSATIATSMAGRKIKVDGCQEWFRILTHVAGTAAATLDCAYTGTTNAAAAFTIFQDEYDLSSAKVRHIVAMYLAQNGTLIPGMDELTMHQRYPIPTASWPPSHFSRIGETKIRFSHYPSQAGRIEVAHTVIPDDISGEGVTIRIPRNWRYVISDGALFWILHVADDSKAQSAGAIYAEGREQMIADDTRKRFELSHRFGREG